MLINFIFLLCILEDYFEETPAMYLGRLMFRYKREDVDNKVKILHKSNWDSKRA